MKYSEFENLDYKEKARYLAEIYVKNVSGNTIDIVAQMIYDYDLENEVFGDYEVEETFERETSIEEDIGFSEHKDGARV